MPSEASKRSMARAAAAVGLGLAGAVACSDIPIENELPPSGIIEGTVVYAGPLPCVQRGHVLGAALMLVFNEDLLPPPEGLATTARTLATVPGDVLFAGLLDSLPATPEGSDEVACPPADAPPVTVSARWSVGPLPAGRYQVRGFYDRDGDFSPVLRIHNLPTAGDVGGGALANPIEALGGANPIYQTIELGVPDSNGKLTIPQLGSLVQGVTVNLGLVLPFGRPVAHLAEVKDERPGLTDAQRQADPKSVRVFVDGRFSRSPTTNAAQADKEFLHLVLRPGVPDEEVATALAPPLSIQTGPSFAKFYLSPQINGGEIATIPEKTSPPIADLLPQVVFAKLLPSRLSAQAEPVVLSSGLVVADRLLNTTAPAWAKRGVVASDQLDVLLRPSVLCGQPADPQAPFYLVTPSFRSRPTDTAPEGETAVDDFDALRAKLAQRFHRRADQIKLVEGCLPPGNFGINLVYGTGQAWSLPNEAGVCQTPQEQPQGDAACLQDFQAPRPRLASQDASIVFGGYFADSSYCDALAQQTPTAGADVLSADEFVQGVPKACLTKAEQADPDKLRRRMAGETTEDQP